MNRKTRRYKNDNPSKFFSMKVNPNGASIGNAVENFKPLGRVVRNVTATAISAPSVIRSKMREREADQDVKTIKNARMYDNASDWNNDGSPSDAQKARFSAQMVKDKLKKRYK